VDVDALVYRHTVTASVKHLQAPDVDKQSVLRLAVGLLRPPTKKMCAGAFTIDFEEVSSHVLIYMSPILVTITWQVCCRCRYTGC
jgi:hypothetical protein